MSSTPFGPATDLMATTTSAQGGELNTSPQTAALSIPSPTRPPCAGSCPLPPPEISVTWSWRIWSMSALMTMLWLSPVSWMLGCKKTWPSWKVLTLLFVLNLPTSHGQRELIRWWASSCWIFLLQPVWLAQSRELGKVLVFPFVHCPTLQNLSNLYWSKGELGNEKEFNPSWQCSSHSKGNRFSRQLALE